MIRVDCNTHKPIPVPTRAQADDTTQCFEVTTASAQRVPYYAIIQAPIGECGATGAVFDCISADYVLIEPACTGSCPLKVTIKTFGSGTAGLGSDKSQFPAVPEFLAPDTSGLGEGKCLSGCRNVQVTVTDKRTGASVAGAQLSASVTPFLGGIAPYPHGFDSGDGHLCLASTFNRCGNGRFITDVPTDGNGRATLLYWAPGAITRHAVKITVKARKACDTCSKGRQSGEATHEVTVLPHLIFTSHGTLDHAALGVLELWARSDGNFATIGDQLKNAGAEHALTSAIKGIAEFYAEKTVPVLLAAEAVHKLLTTPGEYADITTELGQQEALTALFANPLGLSTAGLGGVDAGEFDQRSLDVIAGKDGLLRRLGLASEKLRNRRPILTETLKLRIFEVSYCQLGEKCGPGDSTPGIQPLVYFDFQAEAPPSKFTGGATIIPREHFVLPYDASFFDLLQYNGKGPPGG